MSSNQRLYYPIESIRNTFSKVSTTSFYKIAFPISGGLSNWLKQTGFYSLKNTDGLDPLESIELLCSGAILPGTSLKMTEVIGNRQGVLEKYPILKQYPEVSLTFYVDTNHSVVKFFEEWTNYIMPLYSPKQGMVDANKDGLNAKEANNDNDYFKMRYPKDYMQTFYITKFERDLNSLKPTGKNGKGKYKFTSSPLLTYEFVNAYPSNIVASAVSYEGTSVFTYTVTLIYQRYFINTKPPSSENSLVIPDLKNINFPTIPVINNPNATNTQFNIDGVDQIFSIQPIA